MNPTTTETVAAVLFVLAILHTFLAPKIASLGHRFPKHEGLFHLLGEVEAVFGLWSGALLIFLFVTGGMKAGTDYIDGRNFTEPLFVIAIMVVAASKPVLHVAKLAVTGLSRMLPLPRAVAFYWIILTVVPLLGSFITEPAAMTLGAFMLRDRFYKAGLSARLRYATLGVLFVNVSIGGVLTPYAAPPVLMVAAKWDWNIAFMISHFGWRAALAVAINALLSVSKPHSFLGIDGEGQCSIIRTRGNRYGHVVLRGGPKPNYDSVTIALCEQELAKHRLPANIVVDCSHANSSKKHELQPLVLTDVVNQIVDGNRSILGVMIESHLHAGNQPIPADLSQLKYGVSVTDACVDWETTERMLREAHAKLKDVLPRRIA